MGFFVLGFFLGNNNNNIEEGIVKLRGLRKIWEKLEGEKERSRNYINITHIGNSLEIKI